MYSKIDDLKSIFRARLQFSSRLTKRDACPGTCTLSPLHAAPTMRFTKNTHRDMSKVLRLEVSKVRACHEECNSSSENDTKVLRLPHKTTFDTVWNTWECHKGATRVCDVWNLLGTSESDHCCRTRHRHGHTALTRTLADGCERLGTVAHGLANTASTPKPPVWNGNPCYVFGKNPTCLGNDVNIRCWNRDKLIYMLWNGWSKRS